MSPLLCSVSLLLLGNYAADAFTMSIRPSNQHVQQPSNSKTSLQRGEFLNQVVRGAASAAVAGGLGAAPLPAFAAASEIICAYVLCQSLPYHSVDLL